MTRKTRRQGLQAVAPVVESWSMQVLCMGDAAGSWSQLRWYRLQRLAFRLDSGQTHMRQDLEGRLYVNARRRCRLLETTLQETGYEVQPEQSGEPRGLPAGLLRPRTSWAILFEYEFESHIPRPSTILPVPWRRMARSLLRDPGLGAYALDAFPLPRRWRRLRRRLQRMDAYGARVCVLDGVVEVEQRDGSYRRDRLLEDAVNAWARAEDFVVVSNDSTRSSQGSRRNDGGLDDVGPPPGSVRLAPKAASWSEALQLTDQQMSRTNSKQWSAQRLRLASALDEGILELWEDPGGGLWACMPSGQCWCIRAGLQTPRGSRGGRPRPNSWHGTGLEGRRKRGSGCEA